MKKIFGIVLCLVLGVGSLSGCGKQEETFVEKSYSGEAGQISAVCLDVQDQQIDVSLSADDQVHINYFESEKNFFEISVSEDQVLTMTAKTDKDWVDYVGVKAAADCRKISLALPDALLSALELSTTNEDISLSGLAVEGDLSLSVEGGDILFDRLKVGKTIRLAGKNGKISGTILGSYDDYAIDCTIKKGESNLPESKKDGSKTLTVSNNNGDIEIAFVKD